jgi:hypothetical protein
MKLPSDLEVLDVKADLFSRQVSVMVRSDSFEDVSESSPIPEIATSTSAVRPVAAAAPATAHTEVKPVTPTPKPVMQTLKAESKPEVTVSAAIAKSLTPPANRYAAKMENEFSPEQQKLLSFTTKGDCVVVKPVSFLKAEWDDINETVRSLGGKWVKGDIISYWEIPLS